VRQEEGVTALIIAASVKSGDPRTPKLFQLLLKKFGSSEQINARAARKSRTTALQAAVQSHNVAAIKALIKAGADVTVLDPGGATVLDIATTNLQKLLKGQSTLLRRDLEFEIAEALETISLISESGSWPAQFN
jgi:ankyrin repeat protein